MTWEACDRSAPPRRKLDGARMSARGLRVPGRAIQYRLFRRRAPRHECQTCLRGSRLRAASHQPPRRNAPRTARGHDPAVRSDHHTRMTTVAALVTLGLAFTAPASRLAPPRVSSARMMCAAVMPETPPALESDCGFDHVPLSIALQSGDFLEARPPGPPATTHTACPRRRRRRPFASRRRGWQQTAFAAAASPSPGAALGLLMPPTAP